jgi:hypothetical protein
MRSMRSSAGLGAETHVLNNCFSMGLSDRPRLILAVVHRDQGEGQAFREPQYHTRDLRPQTVGIIFLQCSEVDFSIPKLLAKRENRTNSRRIKWLRLFMK